MHQRDRKNDQRQAQGSVEYAPRVMSKGPISCVALSHAMGGIESSAMVNACDGRMDPVGR